MTASIPAATARAAITFPHAALVFRVRRDVGGRDGQRTTKAIAHCITSQTPGQARCGCE